MKITERFLDHKKGGNCYILKADSSNRWCGFNKNSIDKLIERFGYDFNFVIWGTRSENDFYFIPFSVLSHLFTDEMMTQGKLENEGLRRWTATIVNHEFKMRASSKYMVNIAEFHAVVLPVSSYSKIERDNVYDVDYKIENAKAEINIRLGQSEFRRKVLKNFNNQCCLTGITESNLLVASHIVPWAMDKLHRGNPANGLC